MRSFGFAASALQNAAKNRGRWGRLIRVCSTPVCAVAGSRKSTRSGPTCSSISAAILAESTGRESSGEPSPTNRAILGSTEGGLMRRLQRPIAEIGWTRDVPQLSVTDPVARAFDLMSKAANACVLLRDRACALAGIFTSRDFLNRVAAKRADPTKNQHTKNKTPKPRT